MSWSGSGTVSKSQGQVETSGISASPQSNNDQAREKSTRQIEVAKEALRVVLESNAYDDGEYGASISGHAHSEGDSKDSLSISLYGK